MSKRTNNQRFRRQKADYYRTWDPAAIVPLLPHLPTASTFIEPFAGDGILADRLESHGHICLGASDLYPKKGQRSDIQKQGFKRLKATHAQLIISNPPWSRRLLHQAIEHCSDIQDTWFLFDADWPFTLQERVSEKFGVKTVPELLERCTKIVPIGRLKWFEGSPHKSKENCAWYHFTKPAKGRQPVFYGRV